MVEMGTDLFSVFGAGTIQIEATAEMQGLCCFWSVHISSTSPIAGNRIAGFLSEQYVDDFTSGWLQIPQCFRMLASNT